MEPANEREARTRIGVISAAILAGALGLLPWAGEAFDPRVVAGWLALLACPAGYAAGRSAIAPLPHGLAIPGVWASLLFFADVQSERDLGQPFWGLVAVATLFCLGALLGALGRMGPARGSALVFLVVLAAAAAPLQGGLSDGPPWGKNQPRLAAFLVDASPLVFVLESAGYDWTHAHSEAYRRSGVEWFPRRPHGAPLVIGPSLLVGCALGQLLVRRQKRRSEASTAPA